MLESLRFRRRTRGFPSAWVTDRRIIFKEKINLTLWTGLSPSRPEGNEEMRIIRDHWSKKWFLQWKLFTAVLGRPGVLRLESSHRRDNVCCERLPNNTLELIVRTHCNHWRTMTILGTKYSEQTTLPIACPDISKAFQRLCWAMIGKNWGFLCKASRLVWRRSANEVTESANCTIGLCRCDRPVAICQIAWHSGLWLDANKEQLHPLQDALKWIGNL